MKPYLNPPLELTGSVLYDCDRFYDNTLSINLKTGHSEDIIDINNSIHNTIWFLGRDGYPYEGIITTAKYKYPEAWLIITFEPDSWESIINLYKEGDNIIFNVGNRSINFMWWFYSSNLIELELKIYLKELYDLNTEEYYQIIKYAQDNNITALLEIVPDVSDLIKLNNIALNVNHKL